MQKLQFEEKWEKTISIKDRKRIEQVFSNIKLLVDDGIQLTFLWSAVNYRGDLLLTAIAHNTSNNSYIFQNKEIQYLEADKIIATQLFSIPNLVIEASTSMPWTFIFPKDTMERDDTLQRGCLKIVKELLI